MPILGEKKVKKESCRRRDHAGLEEGLSIKGGKVIKETVETDQIRGWHRGEGKKKKEERRKKGKRETKRWVVRREMQ